MEIFTGVFALIISVACFWMSIKFLGIYFKVKGWIRVNARVISKSVSVHEKFFSARSPYKLNADYTYTIDGTEFKGDKVYLLELFGGRAGHMKEIADKKLEQIKGVMSIYVDPKDHSRSVMFCEGAALYFFIAFMGLFSLLLGISKFM
jgi:hypothetical protein